MPDNLRVFCNSCRRETRHIIQNIYEQPKDDGTIAQWLTIQCAGCDDVSFYVNQIFDAGFDEPYVLSSVYPTRLIRESRQFDGLDARLDEIYREMIVAYNDSSYILCAAGLRALVEGICAKQNITDGPKRDHGTGQYTRNRETGDINRGRTLDCKIEGLAERHVLTEPHARALHEHRYLGNLALHELEEATDETLSTAITIIEHTLDALYNIPAQADSLMRQRGNNHQ